MIYIWIAGTIATLIAVATICLEILGRQATKMDDAARKWEAAYDSGCTGSPTPNLDT